MANKVLEPLKPLEANAATASVTNSLFVIASGKQDWTNSVYAADDTDLKEALPGNMPEL